MRRFFYIMPAVLILMLYTMLTVLAGGISGLQPIVLLYIGFPVLSGVLLQKNQWWGCFFGAAMGAVLLYSGMTAQPRMTAGIIAGLVLIGYYLLMGLICRISQKNK